MSRELHWVQDVEEVKFVLSPEGVIRPKRVPPTLTQDYPPQTEKKTRRKNKRKNGRKTKE
jgi:hypothetical protein